MKFLLILLLLLNFNFLYADVDKSPIGFITISTTTGDIEGKFQNFLQGYTGDLNTKFSINMNLFKISTEDISTVNNTVKFFMLQHPLYIYCYLPNISPESLNEIGLFWGIKMINVVFSPHYSCLTHAIYGPDNCHTKSEVIRRYQNSFTYNIIIGKTDECTETLAKYLNQFNQKSENFYIKDSVVESDIMTHLETLKDIVGDDSIAIYNFIPELAVSITTKFNSLFGSGDKIYNFDIDHHDLSSLPNSVVVGELLSIPDNSDFKNYEPDTDYYTSELLLYLLLEIISSEMVENPQINRELLLFKIYDRKINNGGIDYSLSVGNHLITNIDILNIDENGVIISKTTIDTDFKMPLFQVTGFPKNTTCNIIESSNKVALDGIFIILSFYGNNNYSQYIIPGLLSLLRSIDYINENGKVFDKDIIPIFIDACLSNDDYAGKFIEISESFEVSVVFANALLEDLLSFAEGFSYLNLLYISISPTGGEYCNKFVMNGGISTSSYLNRASQNILKEYKNIFAITSNTLYSEQSMISLEYLEESLGFVIVDSYNMEYPDDTHAQNACTSILSSCPYGCLVIQLTDYTYQEPFFNSYYRKSIDVEKYPVLTFAIDELMIKKNISIVYL